jgi:GNAT superfamily N-acetyltransferase
MTVGSGIGEMLIQLAETDAEIEKCFPVLLQLRPHLEFGSFFGQVRRQQEQGYQLAFLEEAEVVCGVIGFRVGESLAWSKYLYVYDLVVEENARSQGYGQHLFEWVASFGRGADCVELHLDSGVQRYEAHRFYLSQRMKIASHHFSLRL